MQKAEFKSISPYELPDNVFDLIDKQWMLVSAGDKNKFNCMTASWGGLGILWKKPVAFVFIRPTRFTFEFTENNEYLSLSFFDEDYRKVLNLCGSQSGREIDKMNGIGLNPFFYNQTVPAYNEARMILICKKLYGEFLDKNRIIPDTIHKMYNGYDYHKMYIVEIEDVLIK